MIIKLAPLIDPDAETFEDVLRIKLAEAGLSDRIEAIDKATTLDLYARRVSFAIEHVYGPTVEVSASGNGTYETPHGYSWDEATWVRSVQDKIKNTDILSWTELKQ